MLIGVMADTHDNMPKIQQALDALREREVEAILHAGDVVAPFALKLLAACGLPFTAVFGNNDGERDGLKKTCETIYEPPYTLRMGGRTIVLTHDPESVEPEQAAEADLLIHGHTHERDVERGRPLVLNPGEVGGWLSGRSTAAVVDLDSMEAEIIDLGTQETVLI
ncbi:MAG: metallophosphoesterase [Planctomycetota bacterium]